MGITVADDPELRPKKTFAPAPDLRQQLLKRKENEQAARQRLIAWKRQHKIQEISTGSEIPPTQRKEGEALTAAIKAVDDDNLRWLKAIVAESGWPATTQVGEDGAHAAWLLVQHADADPKFQRRCLDLMLQLPKHDYSPTDAAYLTDRVLLAEGKPQLYGTQFTVRAGKIQPRPMGAEAQVNQRRAKVGLGPLEAYAKELEEAFRGKASELP